MGKGGSLHEGCPTALTRDFFWRALSLQPIQSVPSLLKRATKVPLIRTGLLLMWESQLKLGRY